MAAETYFWPRYLRGPEHNNMVRQDDLSKSSVVYLDEGDELHYARRKIMVHGQSVVVFAPSLMGTAEVVAALWATILDTHRDVEPWRG
jgi:hypothetical protein